MPNKSSDSKVATPAPAKQESQSQHKDGSKEFAIVCLNGDHARCVAARKAQEAKEAKEAAKAKAAAEKAARPKKEPKAPKEVVLDFIKKDGDKLVVFANPAMPDFSWKLASYPTWVIQLHSNGDFVGYHQSPVRGANVPLEFHISPSADFDTIVCTAGKVRRSFKVKEAK